MRDRFRPGNLVEARFATHDNYIWRPARAVRTSADYVTVSFSGGGRHPIPRGEDRLRPVGKAVAHG